MTTVRLDLRAVRRLALARAGLLRPESTGLPVRAGRGAARARRAAHDVIDRFGYLQLDTVSVAGARSHVLVLMSRLEGFDPELGEQLLQPGEPLFEYWGHAASWLPLELYPAMQFRREAFRTHPWWGDVLCEHRALADELLRRIEEEGPLKSVELDPGPSANQGWWGWRPAKKVASALWSSGELAIRERRSFQRSYDLASRVIPEALRRRPLPVDDAFDLLLLRALDGHGWAETPTLRATWYFRKSGPLIRSSLQRLCEAGQVVSCALELPDGGRRAGWIRPRDLELADRLRRARPRRDRGVLLSPFDPVLWDRGRVLRLFGFEQKLEIYTPAAQRRWGYFCLPVLAGENLVGRVDLKAHRRSRRLEVLAVHLEEPRPGRGGGSAVEAQAAVRVALQRHGQALGLEVVEG